MESFLFLCICMDFYGFVKICELLYESLDSMWLGFGLRNSKPPLQVFVEFGWILWWVLM